VVENSQNCFTGNISLQVFFGRIEMPEDILPKETQTSKWKVLKLALIV